MSFFAEETDSGNKIYPANVEGIIYGTPFLVSTGFEQAYMLRYISRERKIIIRTIC